MSDHKNLDHLLLKDNSAVLKMLSKMGENTPLPEVVIFSDIVVKINKKEKEQQRALLITDKALYNLMPNSFGKCKRRIALHGVVSITASDSSGEFVLHVPDEYDYRFSSSQKPVIVKLLSELILDLTSNKLAVNHVNADDLKERTLTKAAAKLQTREDRLRRKRELAAEEHDSDKEDIEDGKNESSSLNYTANQEKVRLDDFILLKVLGRGSFGKVMQVRKKSDNKIYAMKVLKKRAIVARDQVEHTRAEREILQALQHPFLMTLRYAFQTKEKLYFVLDYFQGGELFFHLKTQRRFPEEVARIYVGEIALALGHLHSLNFIYRDLKPENILLDDNGHVCLTDFGLSKDMSSKDNEEVKAHTFCGTPEYLAPEIITSVGHDKAVDWWALGILLYELTVGIPPFYSQNVNEMYSKIQHGVLRFPPFLSEGCKSLIIALLNRDPKNRCGSVNDVEDIKAHPFFSAISWKKMMAKEIELSYKPKVKGNDDTDNFDTAFTSEPVVDSLVAPSDQPLGNEFDSFTFQGESSIGN